MDEIQVVTQTLNATIQRHAKVVQAYEVEIANMTAEILRLQDRVQEKSENKQSKNS